MQGIPPQPQAMAPPPIPNQPPASAREAWNSWPQQPQDEKYAQPTAFPYPASGPGPQPLSSHSNPSTSPPSSVRSPNAPPTDSKALLALAEEADEMDGWPLNSAQIGLDGFTPSTSSGNPGSGPGGPIQTDLTGSRRERSSNSSSGDPSLAFSPPLNHLSNPASASISTNNMRVPNQYGQYGREGMPNSPPGGSDRLSEGGRVMGGNPADQNPPVSTHPPTPITPGPSSQAAPLIPSPSLTLGRSTRSTLATSRPSPLLPILPTFSKSPSVPCSLDVQDTSECRSGKRSMDPCALSSLRMCRLPLTPSRICTATTW